MNRALLLATSASAILHASGTAWGQQVAQQQQVASTVAVDEITVYGRGETRQVQRLSDEDITIAAPGTSPLQVIQKLPGVSFQAADPFGAYEWALRISVRGFTQNQLGFTLDGVPLGDMSYGNHNGLHISRAASPENLGVAEIAQGSGALDTASSSNLGGTLKFLTRAPADEFGVLAQMTTGDAPTYRPFVRIDSGALGENGPRMFASYAYSIANKWKGSGKHTYHHVNGKVVQPVGEGELSAFINYSDRREQDYQDLSLDMINRLGYDWDNLFPDYTTSLAIARASQIGLPFPAPIATVDDAYFDASGLRKDVLGYVRYSGPITDHLSASVQAYLHDNRGQGSWVTPYVPSPNGSPVSFRTTEYDIDRKGVVASVTAEIIENNSVNTGIWYENNKYDIARRFYQMGTVVPERSVLDYQSNSFFTQFEFNFDTDVIQFHLQDTWRFDPIVLNFGFKSLTAESTGTPIVGTIQGTIKAEDNFLPQAGITYDLNTQNQLFFSFAENMRAFIASGVRASPFSTTQAGFNAIRNTLKPEKSRTLEGGWRFNYGPVEGVIAAYDVGFKNRLLVVAQGPGIVGAPNALSNVGSVSSRGVELGATVKFSDEVSFFGSYSYNDAKYDDDTVDGNGVVRATARKRVVDAPENLLKGELAYDDGGFFGRVTVSYTGSRFYTYLNDASVPSYALLDLSLGYRFSQEMGFLQGGEVQLNLNNVTDKKYVSTIGSNGFANSDPTKTFQTLQAGSPFQAFVTLRARF